MKNFSREKAQEAQKGTEMKTGQVVELRTGTQMGQRVALVINGRVKCTVWHWWFTPDDGSPQKDEYSLVPYEARDGTPIPVEMEAADEEEARTVLARKGIKT